ncbi:MAG: T9SS type A sorting domain-containing protein [Sphingobacteriales bacterium]|nr:MAG: T9SS type A sorting domain-containing protein [Sphingobacteriales bacterium]
MKFSSPFFVFWNFVLYLIQLKPFHMLKHIKLLVFLILLGSNFTSKAYTLPVTFHVLYAGGPSDQALVDMICDVNEIFRGQESSITTSFPYYSLVNNSGIQFQVTGIVRPTTFPVGAKDVCNPSSGTAPYIFTSYPPVSGTVNIYIVNYVYSGASSDGAYVPSSCSAGAGGRDLIVVKLYAFTKDIISHEIGHYLNLPHVNGYLTGGSTFPGYENCTDVNPAVMASCPNFYTNTTMPQNIMQPSTTGCRVFFTPCQSSNMRRMCDPAATPGGYRPILDGIPATAGTNYNAACYNYKWLMPYIYETSTRGVFNIVVPKCIIPPTYSWVVEGWCAGGSYWQYISSGSGTTTSINAGIAGQPGCRFKVTITCNYGSGWMNSKEFICQETPGAFCSIGCSAPPGDAMPHSSTSVAGLSLFDAISIRPNPVQDFLFVDNYAYSTTYHITNMVGQVLLKGNSTDKIDVSNLSIGNYFIIFHDQNGMHKAVRFVK